MHNRIGCFLRAAMVAAALALPVLAMTSAAFAADNVNVRFSWKLKGEYGFFYLGKEKGLYARQGINPTFGEGAGAPAALGALLQGQEDVVILPGIFAISAIQKGMPIKIVALYQPRAPIALISHADKPVRTPKDLEGKTVAQSVGETATTYLGLFCERNGVDYSKVGKIQMESGSRVPQFLQKKVDVVSVYMNVDMPMLKEHTTEAYPVLDMVQYGLAVPGLAAVASNAAMTARGDVIRRFLAATGDSIVLARSEPAAAAAALKAAWSGSPSDNVIREQIEATTKTLDTPPGKPVGWIEGKTIDDALQLIGSVENIGKPKTSSDFYTNDYLAK